MIRPFDLSYQCIPLKYMTPRSTNISKLKEVLNFSIRKLVEKCMCHAKNPVALNLMRNEEEEEQGSKEV